MKRYTIAICDFLPVGTVSVRDIKPSIYCNEAPEGKWVEYDEAKDSLIVWHKVEDGDWPNIGEDIICDTGAETFEGYLVDWGCGFYSYKHETESVDVIQWAYLPKPPKEE